MSPSEPRRKTDTAMIGLLITLTLNFSALVWGAAKLSAAVDGLRETTADLSSTVEQVGQMTIDLDKRVTVIEATR